MFDFAISNIAWNENEETDVFKVLKRHEIKNLEVAPAKVVSDIRSFSIAEVNAYKREMLSNGFSIVSMQALLYGGPNNNIFGTKEEQNELQKHLLKILDMAEELGARKLVFGSPKNRLKGDLKSEDAYECAAEFFKPLGDRAQEFGASICIENNPVYYGADFLTTTSELCEFINFTNHMGISAHFDTGGMYLSNEDIMVSILKNHDMISHFHVSEKDLLPISTDNISHTDIAKLLKKLKYDKIISLEMKRTENPISDIDNSLKLVREIYQ
ncbi:sugar phosphate isomerase/epimerase [Photobacterium leiognathi subsp. mandapamensis]|uniref:sugar phosphate isomerase/epimerase family protein n=1 Tax=Photobacterium leiognathi TaxID=553611 RepID=UPI000D1550D3|nr:sugar phosphate isomerase/epimerase [Photobacterium leiognathi]PSW65239.1 sugar phosphate isomerase/epimerase [Photobacterium leiognathi subsp. mandapamensis]